MRPTAGAAGRHPARHGGGKLRLEAEQVRRLFARSTLLLRARYFLVALQCQKPNVAWRPRPARFFKSLKTYGLRLGLLGFNIYF